MYTQKLRCDELIMPDNQYDGTVAYARAKRALTVLTELWAHQWAKDNIVVNSMHPGWADTPGVQNALPGFRRVTKKVLRTPDEGADTVIWLARATEADKLTGKLFLDREPRTTHLRARTIEDEGERARLLEWLNETYNALALDIEA
jgi:NAD(P)-dependent dehydrogenase (short-subunit alcohol dehydrogenase family)